MQRNIALVRPFI